MNLRYVQTTPDQPLDRFAGTDIIALVIPVPANCALRATRIAKESVFHVVKMTKKTTSCQYLPPFQDGFPLNRAKTRG